MADEESMTGKGGFFEEARKGAGQADLRWLSFIPASPLEFLPSNNEDKEALSVVDMYACDQFWMFEFKVRRCMRPRLDKVPIRHPGKKVRRRNLRHHRCSEMMCLDFRKESYRRGDVCQFVHGMFECSRTECLSAGCIRLGTGRNCAKMAVMKENFRLHPPDPFLLPHESREHTELLEYQNLVGTKVLVNAFAIHVDPSVYNNPDSFDLDRFLARPHIDHMSKSDPYELIPFEKGLRMYPEYKLANTMVALMLAKLLYVFDGSLLESQTEVDMGETISLSVSKKQPLLLVPKPRFEISLESVTQN
uniref:C3H1-type domain-containing protein n=1 Tax=Physcomitrium patens TaxID=3218 RepID=A0A7I4CX18_PHYPA